MKVSQDTLKFLEELKSFLEYEVGIGEIYGVLGHDSGGVLSHAVLCNDPHCYACKPDGTKIETTLNAEDYEKVSKVYDDLVNIIKKGRDKKFVEKLEKLITTLNEAYSHEIVI